MVQDIKELRSKLRVKTIGDSLDIIVLEDCEVESDQSRPDESIPPEVSAKRDWIRSREASAS